MQKRFTGIQYLHMIYIFCGLCRFVVIAAAAASASLWLVRVRLELPGVVQSCCVWVMTSLFVIVRIYYTAPNYVCRGTPFNLQTF